LVQPAGGDFEGEGGMPLLEEELSEPAEQFGALRPDIQVVVLPTEGEKAEDGRILVGTKKDGRVLLSVGKEHYAEAYMLYRSDPKFLEQNYPQLFKFFEAQTTK